TAFRLYCSAGCYADAERTLARNFSLITDEGEACTRLLRAIPESALATHPTFVAALLQLQISDTSAGASALRYYVALWETGLRERVPQGLQSPRGPIHLEL